MGKNRLTIIGLAVALVAPSVGRTQSTQPAPISWAELMRYVASAAPSGQGPFPLVLFVSGCSGFEDARFADHYRAHSERLLRAGFAVARVDYLKARGVREACADRDAGTWEPRVAADIHEVVQHLPEILRADRARVFVVGWSMGGGAVLAALSTLVPSASSPIAGAVALYPSCRAVSPWRSGVRTLIVLAGLDNIQPALLCDQLVESVGNPASVTVRRFDQAHHGFDIVGEPVIRDSRPSPTVAANPEAAAEAWREIAKFLRGR